MRGACPVPAIGPQRRRRARPRPAPRPPPGQVQTPPRAPAARVAGVARGRGPGEAAPGAEQGAAGGAPRRDSAPPPPMRVPRGRASHGRRRRGAARPGEERGGADGDGRLRYRLGRGAGVRAGDRPARLRGHRPPHAQGGAGAGDPGGAGEPQPHQPRDGGAAPGARPPAPGADGPHREGAEAPEGMSERERQVMKKLKEVVDKQRDEIRAKDRELGLKNEDVEALQQQQNRLMKINHDLRHRITVVEAQGKALIEQKVELEAYLQTKEQEMGNLRAELGKLREKLQGEDSQNGEEEVKREPNNDDCLSESEKMAMDLKDPNRPRFTLQELRDVLHERNELKSKVFLLQEELLYYKSEETEEETRSPQPTPIIQSKPSTQPESGIKRLFSFFSRDKKRMQASQKNVHFQDTFGEWSNSNKDDSYTEQGQEALQHL
uniref:Rab interacting lysosomal protein like 1 n=1 Tax=Falco tinnunculus TaxID=100819 RepID=A0A8C4UKQ2_FALTI